MYFYYSASFKLTYLENGASEANREKNFVLWSTISGNLHDCPVKYPIITHLYKLIHNIQSSSLSSFCPSRPPKNIYED